MLGCRKAVWLCFAILIGTGVFASTQVGSPSSQRRPNVIVIMADDLGWPDLGVQGATDLVTPNINSLATNGVRFYNGYVTSPICSPSRAGFITGRYQQRFGHEINPGPGLEHSHLFGLPLSEATLGDRMKTLGYRTGWIGKSHLGAAPEYHPLRRGFDEFFGFLEGHHEYIYPYVETLEPIQEAGTNIVETNYLTTAFGRECVNFITNHAAEPFFLFAPFNAVHFPMQADSFTGIDPLLYGTNMARYTNAAMLRALDNAVGDILTSLRDRGLETNTLIFFTSDNGAPASSGLDANGSVNTPLRGYKGSLYEGGVRVPFIVQWKGHLMPSVDTNALISTLDILPTAVAAAGESIPLDWHLDGVDLLPYLRRQTTTLPHSTLFWRMETAGGDGIPPGPRAIRSGNWKLVKPSRATNWELYDLGGDLSETRNLADAYPELVQQLIAEFNVWDSQNVTPRWDFNTQFYVTPEFVREDLRIGVTNVSYVAPDFVPNGSRIAFQNALQELWTGSLDPESGFLLSRTGQDALADTGLAPLASALDGPQWGLSTNLPALYYTKAGTSGRLQIWRAREEIGTFRSAEITSFRTNDSFGVRPTQEQTDSVSLLFTASSLGRSAMAWANETNLAGATLLTRAAPSTLNGRWLPGSDDLVYSGYPLVQSTDTQLIRLQAATGVPQLVTTGPGNKTGGIGFVAPELNNELLYAAVVNHTNLTFYRDAHDNTNGYYSPFLSLSFPSDAPTRFIYSVDSLAGLRGFNGVSYFTFATYANDDPLNPGDSAIWLFGLGPDPRHQIIRRLDSQPVDPNAAPVPGRRDPKLVMGDRELFVYYSLLDGTNSTQLRRTRTGIDLPDHLGTPSGFTNLRYVRSFSAGTVDPNGRQMNTTETTALVTHNGWLFAGQSSHKSPFFPTTLSNVSPDWSGAQILVKTSSVAPWQVDFTPPGINPFPLHRRVEALENLRLTTDHNGNSLGGLRTFLVAGMSDISTNGAELASARLRMANGDWRHSHITTAGEEAIAISFGTHKPANIHLVFAGLSNGQIHHGAYHSLSNNLVWQEVAEFSGAGRISSFAEANESLYAAAGLKQSIAGGAVTGGLYRRVDTNSSWELVYRWPFPPDLSRSPETGIMEGLTAVPEPHGEGRFVLIGARSWPGVIERIDPSNDHTATIELDVRDFYARLWRDERVRDQGVRIAYTGFTAATNPISGQLVHLVGIWMQSSDPSSPNYNGSHFLVRHLDGTYEAASIPNDTSGTQLRATRSMAISPFTEERGASLYFGGYDTAEQLSHNTSWIIRGDWAEWPVLEIERSSATALQLHWTGTSDDWQLEASATVGWLEDWQAVPDQPTRWGDRNSLSLTPQGTTTYFRLRRN